jgi:glycosyltransferase involved in cell wall biosynthesis
MSSTREPIPPHVLLVSYLFPPSSRSGARRTAAFRDALEDLVVRTTVLTSTVSGRSPDDEAHSVARAKDARSAPSLQGVVGSDRGRRWWSRLIVPDATVLSWGPAAARTAASILRHDRPDVVFTSYPPESVHMLGLFLSRFGVPWVADFRDGWTFESPTLRPYLTRLDRGLERLVISRADAVTAATAPLADYLQTRNASRPVVHLTNGFDPALVAAASDEHGTLDLGRFSLVYTGTGGLDGKDPRPFLRALQIALAEQPTLSDKLEVVFAGTFTDAEVAAMNAAPLRGVVRTLGHVPHSRSLGLQQAADGLLLITSVQKSHVATSKIYEYLAARKPILGLADRNAASVLLAGAGPHALAAPEDDGQILAALRTYLDRWMVRREPFESDFDLEPFTFPRIAQRLADLFAEIGAIKSLTA